MRAWWESRPLDSSVNRYHLQNTPPEIPLPSELTYLVNLFIESGQYCVVNGLLPLAWHDINAFITATGYQIPLCEKEIILSMSSSYVAEFNRANNKNVPAPFDQKHDKQAIAEAMSKAFESLGKKK